MPFIHIQSLPFEPAIDMAPVVEALTRDFAKGTGVGLAHVTATWAFLPAGHYAVAGKAAAHQPQATHPVLVDLLSPDFDGPEAIETMLKVVAASIARHTGVPPGNIFINHRAAQAGRVFDGGEVVRW
jgi:phenylpyruvate tautomerase PptA (4-oxalocrotonate tautomerase family)